MQFYLKDLEIRWVYFLYTKEKLNPTVNTIEIRLYLKMAKIIY